MYLNSKSSHLFNINKKKSFHSIKFFHQFSWPFLYDMKDPVLENLIKNKIYIISHPAKSIRDPFLFYFNII